MWGVTVDRVDPVEPTVEALAALRVRATARVVVDREQPAVAYRAPVAAIHRVADVMLEIVDSQFVERLDVDAYGARTTELLDAVGGDVDLWEIGNEVNGEWLGKTEDVVRKISTAYARVRARRGRTALTLHYGDGCQRSRDHEMLSWAAANVPAEMRAGLDTVLVSYYEDDCARSRPDWPAVFAQLAAMFPNATLGVGECGTARAEAKEELLERIYRLKIAEPRFVGGFFWWYFSVDMVPKTRPLWSALDRAMGAVP